MEQKKTHNEVDTELYTAATADAVEKAKADLNAEDPEDGAAAMARLLKKPEKE